MRRADRLFEIIQHMRRKPTVRARELSESLEVSERTIYRDIQDLMASGVPIEGEAGVGYVLKAGFDLPPLMFKEQEIEALVLGARMVESWGDSELALAATDAIAKIEAVIPDRLRAYMANTALLAPSSFDTEPFKCDLARQHAGRGGAHPPPDRSHPGRRRQNGEAGRALKRDGRSPQ